VKDKLRSERALIVATVLVMVVIGVVGYLSTSFLSVLCGIEEGKGYCGRLYEGKFPISRLPCSYRGQGSAVSVGTAPVRCSRQASR
jgi:hypothetical protein